MKFVNDTVNDLEEKYALIEEKACIIHEQVKNLPTRKDQALAIAKHSEKAIVFNMLDGADYSHRIWQMVKPPPMTVDSLEDDLQVWKLEAP
jgi:hypothetical protein